MLTKGAIIGIGNVLHRDDGIGVTLLKYLEATWMFPENVELVDGGTVGSGLSSSINDKAWVIILDALDVVGDPGEVRVLNEQEFINRPANTKMSPHQVGFLDLIQLMRLEGTGPTEIDLVGIIPEDLSDGMTLTPSVEAAKEQALDQLFNLLKTRGIVPKRLDPPQKPNYWWLAE